MKNFILCFLLVLFFYGTGRCLPAPNTNTYSTTSPLTVQIDYNGGTNAVYVGRAAAGAITTDAMWQIEYITYNGSGNALTVQWSPNYSTFGDIWASRDSLVFS